MNMRYKNDIKNSYISIKKFDKIQQAIINRIIDEKEEKYNIKNINIEFLSENNENIIKNCPHCNYQNNRYKNSNYVDKLLVHLYNEQQF